MLRPHAGAVPGCADDVAGKWIVADASLGEALHNLIDNAANANGASGHAAAVELLARVQDDEIVVEVADRGPGMPEDVGNALWSSAFAGQPAGMGVGLLLAHTALEHHGGRLEFHSRRGGGTLARLVIPVQARSR